MEKDPLISIVLPTYNGERYLSRSIESCLNQTYRNWELIIVDDASTDGTALIAEKYVGIDQRIRVFRHSINRKLPGALNTGFAHAKGEYLTWTSDDNFYEPHALSEMMIFLIHNPNIEIVYTDYTTIDKSDQILEKREVLSPENLIFNNCVGPSFLYKRIVQEEIGPYAEDLFLAEDLDFWLRASCKFILYPLHNNCYNYRIHSTSLTSLQQDRINIAHVKTMLRNLPCMNWLGDKMKGRAYLELGIKAISGDQTQDNQNLVNYALTTYNMVIHDTDYLLHRLIYDKGGLQDKDHIESITNLFSERIPGIKSFKRKLWATFHVIKCFEAYQSHQRGAARHHFLEAVWFNTDCLNNRGLFHIFFWAFTGINTKHNY
jgi:glycosyltransferase involved in cell wall biosynthesis